MQSNADSVQVGRVEPLAAAIAIAIGVAAASMSGPLSTSPAPWLLGATAAFFVGARRLALALPVILFCLSGWRTAAVQLEAEHARAGLAEQTEFRGTVVGSVAPTKRGSRFSLRTEGGRVRVHARELKSEDLADGDLITVRGRVASADRFLTSGVPSGARALLANAEVALVFSRASDIQIVSVGNLSVFRIAASVRARAVQAIERQSASSERSRNGRALVRALVTGDRSAVSPELADALRQAGIAHLLAVSGLHLAVVGLFAFFVCRRLVAAITPLATRVSPTLVAAIVAVSTAMLYALMTGARPSALRAFAVVFLMLAGKSLYRRARAIDSIGAAAVVLLGWRPFLLFDAGFQMSFGAAIVLVLVARRRPRATGMARLVSTAIGLSMVSTWALIATAPTTLSLFGELSIIGIVVNVVAVPVVELVVLPLSLIATTVSLFSAAASTPLFEVAIAAAGQLASLALVISENVPTLRVSPPTGGQSLLLTTAVVCLVGAKRARRGSRASFAGLRWLVLATASVTAFVGLQTAARKIPSQLRVTFLDVGQGDATLIEFPSGQTWLVDAGGEPGALRRKGLSASARWLAATAPGHQSVLPFLRSQRIRSLEVVVISHAHPDHFLGLDALIGEIPIGRIWLTNQDPDQPWPPELHRIISKAIFSGVVIESPPGVVQVGQARAEFLAPTIGGLLAADPVSSVNDNSLAMIVRFQNHSVLLAGDLELEGEELLVASRPAAIDVDVVKVNHHGSPTSSQPSWVAATSPAVVVVSCGPGNRFGFPSPLVLARWQSIGAVIARTDRDGSVTVTLGSSIALEPHLGRRQIVQTAKHPAEP